MILEYIRYEVPAERAGDFLAAYEAASLVLDASSHCLAWEVGRGHEEPEHFVVRIEWDSLEGHMQGFRKDPSFREFFAAVRPFYDDIVEMKHYTRELAAAAG